MSAFGLPPLPPPGADVLYVWSQRKQIPSARKLGRWAEGENMILPSFLPFPLFLCSVFSSSMALSLAQYYSPLPFSLPRSDDLSRSKQARLSFKGSLVRLPSLLRPSERAEYRQFVRRHGEEGGGRARAELSLKARKFPLLLPLSPLLAPTDERGKGAKRPTNFPQGRTERAGGAPPSLPPSLPPIWADPSASGHT